MDNNIKNVLVLFYLTWTIIFTILVMANSLGGIHLWVMTIQLLIPVVIQLRNVVIKGAHESEQ